MKKRTLGIMILALTMALAGCSSGKTKKVKSMEEKQMVNEEILTEEMKKEEMTNDAMTPMEPANPMTVENPAPSFTFTDFEGNEVALADFQGKPLFIKFWASWCSVCLASFPETDLLAGEDNDFSVITVVAPDVNGEKNAADFETWYNGLDYKNTTVLFDTDGTYMKEFGVRAFPSSAYIGADGELLDFKIGHSSNEKVKEVFANN